MSDAPRTLEAPAENRGSSRWKPFVIAVGALALLAAAGGEGWLRLRLKSARHAFELTDYPAARDAIATYLRVHPRDHEVRLLAADCWSQDDSLDPKVAAENAIQELRWIPETAPQAATARLREARLTFLILHRPTAAEVLLRRSIAIDPGQSEAHYLLWKLYDMTERYFSSEPEFWATYASTPKEQRAVRLREWYMSQFAPLSACSELDGLMGFHEVGAFTNEETEVVRLKDFLGREPDSPMIAAALAQWGIRNADLNMAIEILEPLAQSEEALGDRYFVGALTEVLIERGESERAQAVFQRWPEPRDGYPYWRLAGMIAQECQGDHARAITCYDQALALWPGPSDWLLLRRKSHCLARVGRSEEAEQTRKEAQRVGDLMQLEVHQRLKTALAQLNQPQSLEVVIGFYKDLNRSREAAEWSEILAAIDRNAPPPSRR